MDRVFESGASVSPPSAPGSPSTGYATAGNPGGGTPATKPGPWWYHQITEELRAVIADAGLAPSHLTVNQLLAAIRAGEQQAKAIVATAGGSADILTATFTPAITAVTNGMTVHVRAASANATTTPTFSPNGLTARTIVKGANAALVAGDIAGAGHWLTLQYDSALAKWALLNPAKGVTPTVSVTKQEVSLGAYALTAAFTASHTLGTSPDVITFVARCTSTDKGYAVGDEVVMTEQYNVWTMSSWVSTTQAGVCLSGGIYAYDKNSTSNYSQLTVGKWTLYARLALIS